jgi:hypothetical protein
VATTTVPEDTRGRPEPKRTDELALGDRVMTKVPGESSPIVVEVRLIDRQTNGRLGVFARWSGVTSEVGQYADHYTWQLASEAEITEADSFEHRERIASALYKLGQMYAAGELPVTPDTTLWLRADVADIAALNAVAEAVGEPVTTTYAGSGTAKQYAEVQWTGGRKTYEAAVVAEWHAKNPDYAPSRPVKTAAKKAAK